MVQFEKVSLHNIVEKKSFGGIVNIQKDFVQQEFHELVETCDNIVPESCFP